MYRKGIDDSSVFGTDDYEEIQFMYEDMCWEGDKNTEMSQKDRLKSQEGAGYTIDDKNIFKEW